MPAIEPTRQEMDASTPRGSRANLARRAAALRRNGCTVDQIALALRVSSSTAARLLAREARRQKRFIAEIGGDALHEELERLDAGLLFAFKAMGSESVPLGERLKALRSITEITALRAKLRGLLDRKITIAHADEKPCLSPAKITDEQRAEAIVALLSSKGKAPV